MQLFDTHCHIHEILGSTEGEYPVPAKWHAAGVTDADEVVAEAAAEGVSHLVCVGCTVEDSRLAVNFVQNQPLAWASIGIHPHEAARYIDDQAALDEFSALAAQPKVVAVGECGLDFFYNHSPREAQELMLRFQIELALKQDLPMIFHVREAFAEFWPIFDSYQGIRGVVHSFTANIKVMQQAVDRGLYMGLNGITTFSKDQDQLEAFAQIPLERLVLETDAPFLTPAPYRGKICLPKHVRLTAEFLSELRDEPLDEIAQATTQNARSLFGL